MPDSMTVDELLQSQHQGLLATLEPVAEKPDLVKLTPWVPNGGCLCAWALNVKKTAIESVRATGDSHVCCGKILKVAEITFAKDATIGLADVFAQALGGAQRQGLEHGSHADASGGMSGPFEVAGPGAQHPAPHAMSLTGQRAFTFSCGGVPCASGNDCIACGGGFHCVGPGTTCCGGTPCAPGHACIGCGGRFWCVPFGSTCCGSTPCGPGQDCLGCGGRFSCVAHGSSCCAGTPCAPGNMCLSCGGRFWCVPYGSTCCAGSPCARGNVCMSCAGRFWCVPQGWRCTPRGPAAH
jgi:hypothetical protein